MEGPYPRSRGKRGFSHHDRDSEEYSGRKKRHMPGDSRGGILPAPSPGSKSAGHGETVFRLVCPESRVGCVFGKGGSIIKSLRAETGAKIMIADAAEGADDRVIFISSLDGDRRSGRSKRDNGEADKARGEADQKDSKGEFSSPAQEALVKIHSHIVDGGDHKALEEDPSQLITTRLLVPSSQVGCLLGKGGRVIEQMREDTKTRIRILPRDQLPHCSLPFDEILQIVGDASAVKKAIRKVAERLNENPAHEHIQFSASVPPCGPGGRGFSIKDMEPPRSLANAIRNADLRHQEHFALSYPETETRNSSYAGEIHSGPPTDVCWPIRGIKDELVFRLLCPNEKIGGIIGKGGNIIRSLQEDIGVRIKVLEPVTGANERIIVIVSVEHPEDDISPAQEALLHLQSKIADLGPDDDAVITSRLLVPSDLVGCLLGKGGSVITEIRRSTRANIRILGKDDLPKCALPSDELVQIVGEIRVAREALIQVTKRLRRKCFEEKFLSSSADNTLPTAVASKQSDYGSPCRMDFPRPAINSLGLQSSSYQASTPPWTSQDAMGGRNLRDSEPPLAQQGPNFRLTGALVTRTTMEVVIPAHAITAIIGDGGSRIVRIRQISGAKVDLLDVRSGASEGVVKISGTPEQTQAAQNLLQELILRGQTSHGGYAGELYAS